MTEIDAVLLVSFGGPEGMDEVMPYLQRVTAGRGVPQDRLEEVAEQYRHFGGVSPINSQNRQLVTELQAALNAPDQPPMPVYWGNRNSEPFLADALQAMRADGVRTAAAVITSGYSSYSSCRQYRENLYDAVEQVQADAAGAAPQLIKVRRWFDHPVIIDIHVDNVIDAIESLGSELDETEIVFTTHSIPLAAAAASGSPSLGGNLYVKEHRAVMELVMQRVHAHLGRQVSYSLVYQSRSGPPQIPWLEPDINDHLTDARQRGINAVVVAPIGFASDHMEVMWDLDTQARETAAELDLKFARVATPGGDPRFALALAEMVNERVNDLPVDQRPALGQWGPAPDLCPAQCCANPRDPRPTLCGSDS